MTPAVSRVRRPPSGSLECMHVRRNGAEDMAHPGGALPALGNAIDTTGASGC